MNLEKKIYYCWFGKKEKPEIFKTYLASWVDHFPKYQIIEINETNFDIDAYPYAKSAYEAGKFAFVSDCARVHFLQQNGGIYFDTDVEVRKDFGQLLENREGKVLFSMEYFQYETTGVNTAVIISEKNCFIWEDLLKYYLMNTFITEDEPKTINMYISELLQKQTSFVYKDISQVLKYKADIINIVESKYLMKDTKEAYAVHHLAGSWTKDLSFSRKIRRFIGIILKKILGRSNFERLWNKK